MRYRPAKICCGLRSSCSMSSAAAAKPDVRPNPIARAILRMRVASERHLAALERSATRSARVVFARARRLHVGGARVLPLGDVAAHVEDGAVGGDGGMTIRKRARRVREAVRVSGFRGAVASLPF